MIVISRAISSLYPTAEFIIENEDYNKIRWTKDEPENFASLEELVAEVERLEALDIQRKYQQLRKVEYPPMTDYLDAVYWQSQGDNTKMTAYLTAVAAVKEKYPKGDQ
jgi:hypothetical protein